MILYVNGDSHTAGAEAVNPHAFAEDDGNLFYMGRAPHPDNLSVSWGKLLSLSLNTSFHCDAESASSNTRILRTTRDWLSKQPNHNNILIIIQWSTWEREEWLINDIYYQVNGSGVDTVPQESQEKYKQYIIGLDWKSKTEQAHKEIWEFHNELSAQGIKHIFFSGNCAFNQYDRGIEQRDWGNNYIGPYNPKMTYDALIRAQGINTVAPDSWHFGKDGHSYFHRFMLQYIIDNNFI
jgi:hypothetical protein